MTHTSHIPLPIYLLMPGGSYRAFTDSPFCWLLFYLPCPAFAIWYLLFLILLCWRTPVGVIYLLMPPQNIQSFSCDVPRLPSDTHSIEQNNTSERYAWQSYRPVARHCDGEGGGCCRKVRQGGSQRIQNSLRLNKIQQFGNSLFQ